MRPFLKDIFQSISAKADGEPCCDWVGEGGSGHYVKMVHNGIEYGDMQMICEAYQLLKEGLGCSNDEMSEIFDDWNKRELDSFLIQISRDILKFKDADGKPLLEKIRDSAGQKGTGKWTAISALDAGMPVTLIGEAVFARCLSSLKEERVKASSILKGPKLKVSIEKNAFIQCVFEALYASKIVSYAQGYMLLSEAAKLYGWNLNYGGISTMWKGGCIIRSAFLKDIKNAFKNNSHLTNLMLDPFFQKELEKCQNGWRRVVAEATLIGIPVPAMSSALSFYDGYRCPYLPANLLQAQRDYFGAHTYELVDEPGKFIHTNWTGHGGNVSSSSYSA